MTLDIPALKLKLQQLAHQRETGALTPAQFEEQKKALERQLLDRVLESGDVPLAAGSASAGVSAKAKTEATTEVTKEAKAKTEPRLPASLLASVLAVVMAVAAAGYAWKGSPGSASASAPSLAQSGAGGDAGAPASDEAIAQQIEAMTEKLATHLKTKPDDGEGWAMLARTTLALGRLTESLPAFERALALRASDAQLMADYADALAVSNNRVLAGEPMKWINKALEVDPRNLKALTLAGAHAFESANYPAAVNFWERVVQLGPTDGEYLKQVQASLAEARRMGGLPAGTVNSPEAGPLAQPSTNPVGKSPQASAPGAAGSASVSGTVSLAPALAAGASPEDTLFVFARGPEGRGVPLAVLRKKVKDLPLDFTLDDSLAMSPTEKISGATAVVISARISKSGDAMPQPGDLFSQTGPVRLGARALKLEIRDTVKP